jgi:hypothetical protein
MRIALVPGLALVALACDAPPPPPDQAASGPPFQSTVSIEEVMRYMVDPSADAIWESVVTIVSDDGVQEIRPETDEDWERLRGSAVTLTEATNLLLMEDRRVAAEGSVSELPGVDLEPEQIEALLAEDRDAWTQFVLGLHESGVTILEAIDAHDVDALLVAGDGLDLACENCHQRFWYPDLGPQSSTATN